MSVCGVWERDDNCSFLLLFPSLCTLVCPTHATPANVQVGRAYGNRGNARSRMGRLGEALADYNKSIQICPWSVDPVLNR